MTKDYEHADNFKDFRALNIDRLAAAFSQIYGNRIDEAADFFEAEFERHMLAHAPEKQPPAERAK